MPTQTTERTFTLKQLEEVLSDRSLHLQQSKATAIRRRFEELLGIPAIATVELVDSDTFTHTGVLLVRVHASDAEEARELLAKAASAALEADPFIRRVEGTSVTPNPKRK